MAYRADHTVFAMNDLMARFAIKNVYGCDDRKSVVIVTAPGNPAMPFYFFFVPNADGYQLHGEGNGNKAVTDAAYKDLTALTAPDIAALVAEAGRP